MITSIARYLVDLPLPAELLLKVTLLLAVVWLLHAALEKANPRWRVLLWRATAAACLALPFIVLGLPAWSLPLAQAPTAADQQRAFLRRLAIAEYAEAVGISYDPFAGMTAQPAAFPETSVTPAPEADPSLMAELEEGPALEAASLTREVLLARQQAAESMPPATAVASATPSRQTASVISTPVLLIAAWLGAVLFLAARLALQHWALRLHIKDSWPVTGVVSGLARRLMERLGVSLPVDVRSSSKIASPFLIGVSAPVIMLSERIAGGRDEKELRSVLAHELAHVAERDVLWSLIIEGVAALLWFHPLAWKMRAAHAAACEEAADLAAAECVGDPRLYSAALARVALDVLSGPKPVAGTVPMARIPEIRQRLEKLRRAVKGGSPRGHAVYTGIAFAAVLVVALGSLHVVEADDTAPAAPVPGSPQAAPAAPPAPLAPRPGAPGMRYRVQLNGAASDADEAAENVARTLTFEHAVTDVVDINGKRTVFVGATQDRREAAEEQAGALRSQGLDCTVVEVPAPPMPPPGMSGADFRKDLNFHFAREAVVPAGALPAEWPALPNSDPARLRAAVLSLEPISPKLDTDEKKQAFVAQIREVVETLLYTGTTKEEAEKQGRKTWFDDATYRLTVTDTADRIAVVLEYLQSVPELEKSSIRRTSTGFSRMPESFPREIAEARARVAEDSGRVRTLERSLVPPRAEISKEIAEKLRTQGFILPQGSVDGDIDVLTEALESESGENREQLVEELRRLAEARALQAKELAQAHADEARARAEEAMLRAKELQAAKRPGGDGGKLAKQGPTSLEGPGESSLARTRDEAIQRGDIKAAYDAEMQRVAARSASGHSYKDKITLLNVAEKANKAGLPWTAIAEATGEYLEAHKDEPDYGWRIYQAAARAAQEIGETNTAIKCYKAALESYPDNAYADPAKHSSYQHLMNQYLGFISKTEGPKAAEEALLQAIEKDPKFDAPYLNDEVWKSGRKPADYEKLQKKVESARKTRAANGL